MSCPPGSSGCSSAVNDFCRKCVMFDPRELMSYAGGDLETCNELVMLFSEQALRVHLPALETAIPNNDRQKCHFHAHTLKGSSSFLGAFTVKWLCEKLCFLARERDTALDSSHAGGALATEAAVMLIELRNALYATVEELQNFAAELDRHAPEN